jgi:hypothetical protein
MVLVLYFLMSAVITSGMRILEARTGLRYGARTRRLSKVLVDGPWLP